MSHPLSISDVQLFIRNVRTRMPFRYGVATLVSVPMLHLQVDVELADGKLSTGYAADILPPKWFDKDPAKDYEQNVEDLIHVAMAAVTAYREASARPRTVFDIWRDGYSATIEHSDRHGLNHLTASHGSSLMERALIDALGVALDQTYHDLLTTNELGLDLASLHGELTGVQPADVISPEPLRSIILRHTVGLNDPILASQILPEDRLDDGLPQALEEYAVCQGLTYFKVKISGDLNADLDRLREIASILDENGSDYKVTLDGNEQFKEMESFERLVADMRGDKALHEFFNRILYIEQPLDRAIALDSDVASGIRAVAAMKPILVDESDGDINSFRLAIDRGYTGVSTKNCKGLIKAVANQALARYRGERTGVSHFLSAEDLMNLPIVPVHQDLTHIAALGIDHAERNGHHYVRGLDHLSPAERSACEERHGNLYEPVDSMLALRVDGGRVDVSSLQVPGLGVGVLTDTSSMVELDNWSFASL